MLTTTTTTTTAAATTTDDHDDDDDDTMKLQSKVCMGKLLRRPGLGWGCNIKTDFNPFKSKSNANYI
jgi:hypothetical protein